MATVLVIDDDQENRAQLICILRDLGYTTFEATDGRAGIGLFRDHMPDVVLLEVLMSERDGFETLFQLRRVYRNAKIVMMTRGGRVTNEIYERMARSLGLPDLLIRPFSAEVLAQSIALAVRSQIPESPELLPKEA